MKPWAWLLIGAVLGVAITVVGFKGCSDEPPLVQRDAELQTEVERHRILAHQAEERRAKAAHDRDLAKAKLAQLEEENATLSNEILKRPRPTTYRQAVTQLDTCLDVVLRKDQAMDLVKEAVDAYEVELNAASDQTVALQLALEASEERADLWKRRSLKDRRKKIAIGVGSALGGSLLTLGAVAAAGRLQ